jgi:hypothetical protein
MSCVCLAIQNLACPSSGEREEDSRVLRIGGKFSVLEEQRDAHAGLRLPGCLLKPRQRAPRKGSLESLFPAKLTVENRGFLSFLEKWRVFPQILRRKLCMQGCVRLAFP